MARQRLTVSNKTKKRLRAQAGGKCANPGCATARTHVHHIQEWAAYETNDEEYLIAVCPTCHDAIHHGTLAITDETIYAWKTTRRVDSPPRGHIYVEPSGSIRLLLGSLAIAATQEAIVFDLGASNSLSFRIVDGEILLVDLHIRSLDGQEVVRVSNNHWYIPHPSTRVDQVPGHVLVSALNIASFIPTWMVGVMREYEPEFGADGTVRVLEIEVVKPGVVRVQGIWVEGDVAIVITARSLNLIRPGLERPISLVGAGESSVLLWRGPINKAMFGVGR